MNSESVQHRVGGSTESTESSKQKELRVHGPIHWRPEQRPFTRTWQPLPVLIYDMQYFRCVGKEGMNNYNDFN